MKKIKRNTKRNNKRNFAAPKTNNFMLRYDNSYKGFLLDHESKIIYAFESTDTEIRNGNEDLLNRFIEIEDKYPNYSGAVLHVMFVDLDA